MKFPETYQEIFDGVLLHLRIQKVQSYSSEVGICLYRGPNGTKCAIGAFITDEEYFCDMESNSIISLSTDLNFTKFDNNRSFWSEMQKIHDDFKPEEWEEIFEQFAFQNNLNYSRT